MAERGHGTFQVGQKDSPIAVGLRDHSMRTPGQFQQNFPRELAISEAAALAGADAIQFRLDHATEERAIGVLKAVRDASGWDDPPFAASEAVVYRVNACAWPRSFPDVPHGTYWACVCQIAVSPDTGEIVVEKYTIAVDPGIVVNPVQLKRQVEGGAVMGISHALLEEVMFDESGDHPGRLELLSDPEDGGHPGNQGGVAAQSRSRNIRRWFGSGQCARCACHCRRSL